MAELARRSLTDFIGFVEPRTSLTPFHEIYFGILDRFARGVIRRLIVSVPPQHGKSFGASQMMPAYLLGIDPSRHVAIASYSFSLARSMALSVSRVIGSRGYREVFPATMIKGMGADPAAERTARRTAQQFDCVGHDGGLLAVGREGSLTGNRVDVMIMDDLYKDMLEANSPLVRTSVWDWYNAVVRTRLHNDSQELMVFTRWHAEDLIGRIADREPCIVPVSLDHIDTLSADELARNWIVVNFEALKTGLPTLLDSRTVGEALWPERHSRTLLLSKRESDPVTFEALYQGNPASREGLLWGEFKTYRTLPTEQIVRWGNYTDTADMGDDCLCSICYGVGRDGCIYLTDVVLSAEPMESTEGAVVAMIRSSQARSALFESNNGGRGFARAVQRELGSGFAIRMFHQSANKESRIVSNAATVARTVIMPWNWQSLWPEFAVELLGFKRAFRANKHDDAADVLTGIVEHELGDKERKISYVGFGRS